MSFNKDSTQPDIWTPFELVGIHEFRNGRRCDDHLVCGKSLQINDIVRIRSVFIKNGKLIVV